jgi:hypothetical protein
MRVNAGWVSAIAAAHMVATSAGAQPPPRHSTAESDRDPSFVAAAANHIYAQRLVNELSALHPDVKVIALHATRPGSRGQTMIAATLDRIGKEDDEDDQAVVRERKSIIAPRTKPNPDIELLIPAEDSSGNTIGLLGLLFTPRRGETQLDIFRRGTALRDWLARRTPSLSSWFAPAVPSRAPGR